MPGKYPQKGRKRNPGGPRNGNQDSNDESDDKEVGKKKAPENQAKLKITNEEKHKKRTEKGRQKTDNHQETQEKDKRRQQRSGNLKQPAEDQNSPILQETGKKAHSTKPTVKDDHEKDKNQAKVHGTKKPRPSSSTVPDTGGPTKLSTRPVPDVGFDTPDGAVAPRKKSISFDKWSSSPDTKLGSDETKTKNSPSPQPVIVGSPYLTAATSPATATKIQLQPAEPSGKIKEEKFEDKKKKAQELSPLSKDAHKTKNELAVGPGTISRTKSPTPKTKGQTGKNKDQKPDHVTFMAPYVSRRLDEATDTAYITLPPQPKKGKEGVKRQPKNGEGKPPNSMEKFQPKSPYMYTYIYKTYTEDMIDGPTPKPPAKSQEKPLGKDSKSKKDDPKVVKAEVKKGKKIVDDYTDTNNPELDPDKKIGFCLEGSIEDKIIIGCIIGAVICLLIGIFLILE